MASAVGAPAKPAGVSYRRQARPPVHALERGNRSVPSIEIVGEPAKPVEIASSSVTTRTHLIGISARPVLSSTARRRFPATGQFGQPSKYTSVEDRHLVWQLPLMSRKDDH